MGDESLQQRYHMFLERRRVVEEKMAELQEVLDTIRHKCWYYETAIAAGTEKIHFHDETFAGDGCLKDMEEKP